ncbi:MAG: hypothetical protein E6Q73_14140 [Pseudorhodobacter sp.]|nr:MAG: hypothetical protein E6Q73_14140 [Pseudorhodobacter sp.]
MLPHLKASALTLVTALAVATSAAPAQAWGQREQDTLKGAVGALVLKAIIDDARRDRAPVYSYVPEPQPRPYHGHGHGHGHAKPKPAVSIYSTPAARAFNSYSRSQRYQIQRTLAHWGYYRGGIDGSFGPGTYSAVSAYARDQGQSLGSTARAFGVYDGLIY